MADPTLTRIGLNTVRCRYWVVGEDPVNETGTPPQLPPRRWDPAITGNLTQIGTLLIAVISVCLVLWQLSKLTDQLELSHLSSFNQTINQCFEAVEHGASRSAKATPLAVKLPFHYLPSSTAARLIACLDVIGRLDQAKPAATRTLVNVASIKELSILWEDRLVEELNRDAEHFLEFKKSNCNFAVDSLERIRRDFVVWYMLVHPRDEPDLEKAFDREIVEHREDIRKSRDVDHAKRFLGFAVGTLDEIKKPCSPSR